MCAEFAYLKAPAQPLFDRWLKDSSAKNKRLFYQALVFFLTFVSFATYHINKRPFSVIKSVLSPACNKSIVTPNCLPWEPFSGHQEDKYLFSLLDFTFMITYSLSLLASGYIAENTNLRIFLSCGMMMTGVTTALFGLARYFEIHSLIYFFIMQILAGVTHSTGLPCATEAIGMWFPKGSRGTTYGLIGVNSFIGNIIGSAVAGHFSEYNWGLSFIVPAIIIMVFSVFVYLFLVPSPTFVNINIEICPPPGELMKLKQITNGEDEAEVDGEEEEDGDEEDKIYRIQQGPVGIDLWSAWKIPGVKEYSLSVFFVKLIGYTFFFWLPYFIRNARIGDRTYTPADAAYYSIFFDIGGGCGGILAGIVYDYTDSPAIICTIMLVCAAPNLLLFMIKGTTLTMFLVYMFLTGCFAVGPVLLIVSIVSARLGSNESLKSIAVISAIFDAFGSTGASFGPLLAGFITARSNTWSGVVCMLVICDVIAAVVLSRQCYNEIAIIRKRFRETRFFEYKTRSEEEVNDVEEAANLLENVE